MQLYSMVINLLSPSLQTIRICRIKASLTIVKDGRHSPLVQQQNMAGINNAIKLDET